MKSPSFGPRPSSVPTRVLGLFAAVILSVGLSGQGPASGGLYDKAVLRSLHLRFAQADWWNLLHDNRPTETFLPAELTVDGRVYQDVGVRFRGQTSFFIPNRRGAKKLPLRIGMDAFVPGQRLQGRRSLVLNNGFWDPTFMREALAMELMREFVPTPEVNWVKLYINGSYWGLYINVEAPNRDFLASRFLDSTGNRYKGDADFRYRGADPKDYVAPYPLVSSPAPDSHGDLAAAMATLGVTPEAARIPAVESRIDVDLALRLLAANAVLANPDGFPGRNYYLYPDPYHGRLAVLPWDTNYAFVTAHPIPATPAPFDAAPDWVQRYRAYLREIAGRALRWPRVEDFVTRHQALLEAAVQADPNRLYAFADFRGNLTREVRADGFVKGLRPVVEAMRDAVANTPELQIPALDLLDPQRIPQQPSHRDPVTFRVRVETRLGVDRVAVHLRTRGGFAVHGLFDDGRHGDGLPGDGIFAVTLPPLPAGSEVRYYFSARTPGPAPAVTLLPGSGGHRSFGYRVPPRHDSVLIHEFLASNQGGLRDEHGEDDDWIELVNPTAAAVPLDGMFLTDDLAHPRRFGLPVGTTLQPGETLLLWADDQPQQGPLHANFKLAAEGEVLALYAGDGVTLLDAVGFGPQERNVSTGRLGTGPGDSWVAYPEPSPRRRNDRLPDGWRAFTALLPAAHRLRLELPLPPRVANPAMLQLRGGPGQGSCYLLLGSRPAYLPLPWPDLALLLDPRGAVGVLLRTDATGTARMMSVLPDAPHLVGLRWTAQAFAELDGVQASNAVEFEIRP